MALISAPVDTLSQEEWELVKDVCTVLQPFEEVTVEISTDRYLAQFFFLYYSVTNIHCRNNTYD